MSEAPIVRYRGSPAVELDLFRGEATGLVGPSGAGKTTLIEAVARAAAGAARIAYLPQRPRDLFPSQLRVGAVIETMARLQPEPSAYKARWSELLEALLLDSDAVLRAPSESLSEGEVQRVALAALVASRPDILLADEPSASLDPESKAALTRLLASIREKSGLAVLVASHDTAFVRSVAGQIFTLVEGRLVQLSVEESALGPSRHEVAVTSPVIVEVALARHEVHPPPPAKSRTIISNFHQSFSRGVVYGMTGPSGVGKSTLLRIISGHDRPSHGRVEYISAGGSRPRCLLAPQDARRFFNPRHSMQDHARLLAARTGKNPAFSELAKIMERLELPGMPLLKRRPHEVSGGEAQRLALAIALWLDPQILCLDEIDTGVPVALKKAVALLILERVRARDRVALVVSHDVRFLSLMCDHVIDLERCA